MQQMQKSPKCVAKQGHEEWSKMLLPTLTTTRQLLFGWLWTQPKFNQISKENLKRIEDERKIFTNKIVTYTPKKYRNIKFNFPAKGIVSSEYGVKRFINGSPRNPHLGLDIAAETGTKIISPENGKVIFVGNFFYRGKIIIIDHGNGIISTYSHLNETFVSEGDNVLKNSKIGTVGSSGRVTGPHLHFEIILLGIKVNPMLFL